MAEKNIALDKGIFTLSLDTELCWGMVDKPESLNKNMPYYKNTRECIDKILSLLEKYNIPATWAIVGHLFLSECQTDNEKKHSDIPRSKYPWYTKDWFSECPCTNINDAPLWYGEDIVKKIMSCKVEKEIASHSFSHIPFGNENTKRETVVADLKNCLDQADRFGLKLKSFVFPRNDKGFLNELKNAGFIAYRGKESSWYSKFPNKLAKACHILDQFLAIKPWVSVPVFNNGMINIPASMLYISMDGYRRYIPLKSRILKANKGINKAINEKKVFHLWFHPFNIASNPKKLLCGLEEILKKVDAERKKGNLEVKTMNQVAKMTKDPKGVA